jgi:DNA-3-methyladenine glycosylase
MPARPGQRRAARNTLPRDFFDRSALEVAPALLGCVLEHSTADGVVAVSLSEVEAYMAAADPASHAYRGMTARNAVMFGPPGHAYVYFTYGMHFCVNVVCGPPGTAEAVLLRAGRVTVGEELARSRRGFDPTRAPRDLARGPARLCQALEINRTQNGADLCDPSGGLWLRAAAGTDRTLAEDGRALAEKEEKEKQPQIDVGPRVGVSKAADIPWRFWLAQDPTVSVYRPSVPRVSRSSRREPSQAPVAQRVPGSQTS